MDAASAPLVAIAATAPNHTITGDPFSAAIVAAVICPTSPHSEKKIVAKETIAAFDAVCCIRDSFRSTGFRQRAIATPMKLMLVTAATRSGGKFRMALPTATATPIFIMKATTMPVMMGTVRYRVARTPVV